MLDFITSSFNTVAESSMFQTAKYYTGWFARTGLELTGGRAAVEAVAESNPMILPVAGGVAGVGAVAATAFTLYRRKQNSNAAVSLKDKLQEQQQPQQPQEIVVKPEEAQLNIFLAGLKPEAKKALEIAMQDEKVKGHFIQVLEATKDEVINKLFANNEKAQLNTINTLVQRSQEAVAPKQTKKM